MFKDSIKEIREYVQGDPKRKSVYRYSSIVVRICFPQFLEGLLLLLVYLLLNHGNLSRLWITITTKQPSKIL